MQMRVAEYLWIDGANPTGALRSKSRTVIFPNLDSQQPQLSDFPRWSFDGSSTNQAFGEDSDCILQPVNFFNDPISDGNYIVLCEVLDDYGVPHSSNKRAQLRQILDDGGDAYDMWIGFEQEYTMFKKNIPLGWPEHGYPAPQGPYYCGVGSEQIFGRELAIKHRDACLKAGILYFGMNAEVMPGQWEYQIGYRNFSDENVSALNVSDHLWVARWLLHRLSEDFNIHVSHENKPIKGDWNGAGMHTNFSTSAMRDRLKGKKTIDDILSRLKVKHKQHIKYYGHGLEERLTGRHETSTLNEFSFGIANRTCSIRIPRLVKQKGCGYLEDRRPGANADPYVVSALLLSTIACIEFSDIEVKTGDVRELECV
ncbi:MAG: glutamine synthetase beta-grasp domain-containing protein [Legionellales bacterium]|nr:glutamine synthetase beta-grasp domain-containing protein [Legionellales bacterium]